MSNSYSMQEKVIELLNNVSLYAKESMRLNHINQIHEIIIYKEPNLLDNFLDEMLAFQNDRSSEVRKTVIVFIEDACRSDAEVVVKVIDNLRYLLYDENAGVGKRAIGATASIYKYTLKWISKLRHLQSNTRSTWERLQELKDFILLQMNSENDGIRIATIHFLQALAVILSFRGNDQPISDDDFCLEMIPEQHRLLDRDSLADEGQEIFKTLLSLCISQRISSANLIACMICLADIAKVRPQRLTSVIQAFETLHVNLPPTLTKSEVLSVRKQLKLQLLSLLKNCSPSDQLRTNMATLLTDLGATRAEVMKCIPNNIVNTQKHQEKRKPAEDIPFATKKAKLECVPSTSTSTTDTKDTCIDITAADIVGRLTETNVVDLVLLSMVVLPDQLPPSFVSTYTPIAGAGSPAQINHLARLLAAQMTSAGLGKGFEQMQQLKAEKLKQMECNKPPVTKPIASVVGVGRQELPPSDSLPKVTVSTSAQPVKKPRMLKLTDMVKPLTYDQMNEMTVNAFKRILSAEEVATSFGQTAARRKIIASLVTMSGKSLRDIYEDYIFAEFKRRGYLAFDWLFQEYALMMGFLSTSQENHDSLTKKKKTRDLSKYDDALTRILESLQEKPDQKDRMFSKVVLAAPYLTENALFIVKKYCTEEARVILGMQTLRDLVLKREPLRDRAIAGLLSFTHSEKLEIRLNAVRVVKELYEETALKETIENYALQIAKYLQLSSPPSKLFQEKSRDSGVTDEWSDESVKMCLLLLLSLMTSNHSLIHSLAAVYTASSGDVKRSILKLIETPIRTMGIDSPELLKLVESCPKGAETMITRVIHILTDKSLPSEELVDKVRELYEKRIPDVRFLIPVLGGLRRDEIIPVLPRLIKLTPAVVKEVFNRLLWAGRANMPISPVELMVALHQMPASECDLKSVIAATGHCFAEKNIYNQQVMEEVIQKLSDLDPLPVLSMRTILQSIVIHPKITAFVVKILEKVATKEIWKVPRLWQGFLKCCQRTRPHCYPMIINLPKEQIMEILSEYPELKSGLSKYIATLSSRRRASLNVEILDMLNETSETNTIDSDKLNLTRTS